MTLRPTILFLPAAIVLGVVSLIVCLVFSAVIKGIMRLEGMR